MNDEIESYLRLQEQSVQKLDGYLRNIVFHSDNNNSDLAVTPIDLKEMVQELYAELEHNIPEFKLEKEMQMKVAGPFYSDPTRIRTVMLHLLANAWHFSDPTKENPLVRTHITPGATGIEIRVEDNGIGIEPEIRPQIFDMLFRGSVRSRGAGMGLFIVQEVVRKLGGTIQLQSQVGQGSVFIVELPSLPQSPSTD